MEVKKVTVGPYTGWWEVIKPDKRIIEYLRREIPPLYRHFDGDTMRWYVQQRYADSVKQLVSGAVGVSAADDPWALLHLRPGAPPAIIKAVWREMVKSLHPDHGGNEEQFKKVKEAFEKLTKE